MAVNSVKITQEYVTSSITGAAKTRAELVYTDANDNEHENPNSGTIDSLTVVVGYGTSNPYTFTIPDRPTLVALRDLFDDIVSALDPDSDTVDEITW